MIPTEGNALFSHHFLLMNDELVHDSLPVVAGRARWQERRPRNGHRNLDFLPPNMPIRLRAMVARQASAPLRCYPMFDSLVRLCTYCPLAPVVPLTINLRFTPIS